MVKIKAGTEGSMRVSGLAAFNAFFCLSILALVQALPVPGQALIVVQIDGSAHEAPSRLLSAISQADGQIVAATLWSRAWVVRSENETFLDRLRHTSGVIVLRAPITGAC